MSEIKIVHNKIDEAISVMQEVAAWGREHGFRVWPKEWLEKTELLSDEVKEEHFCLGELDDNIACAFILQDRDLSYWPTAPVGEAVYLHKLCVRRKFAHQGMTRAVVEAIRKECLERKIKYIRLDTALDEKVVRKIYLSAGFKIVDIIDYENGRSMALYEMEV